MFNLLIVLASLSAPRFKVGDVVIIQDSEFANCHAEVVEVFQPPGQNTYDLGIYKCPNRWIKGFMTLHNVPENFLSPVL